MLKFIMLISIVICIVTIAISVWVTNRAYDVLSDVHKIDPMPKEKNESVDNEKLK